MGASGHSHSFLYTGNDLPSIEEPEGPYPTLITQPGTTKVVPVVQAYAYTKYLGYMNLTFNDAGELTHWDGAPILLVQSMPQGI
jgi:2',3'-cyclic-nucleotide 2'-phosphodiesterase (5'-nucleotidase family)